VRAASAALAEAESAVGSKRDEIRALQKEADAMNLDVKATEAELAKLELQQLQAKSNKEYDIFKREIEAAKQKESTLEDGVLERLEHIDGKLAEQRQAESRVQVARKALDAAKGEAAGAESAVLAEEAALKKSRGEKIQNVEPELRYTYEQILKQRKDTAIASAVGGVCSRCSRKITRQMEAMLDFGQEVVQCMSCSRILYVDETSATP
jgi:predicted  nucleic acid-binding Zn-ribbon protein